MIDVVSVRTHRGPRRRNGERKSRHDDLLATIVLLGEYALVVKESLHRSAEDIRQLLILLAR